MTPSNTSYREIPLTQGKVALVSAHRYAYLSQFKWCASRRHKTPTYYAVRWTYRDGIRTSIYMHREILEILDQPIQTDHVNGNGLDNRDENIRPASASQNMMNRFAKNGGVHKVKRFWQAHIRLEGHGIYLGSFDTEHDAKIAYAVAARLLYGNFRHITVPRFERNEALARPASAEQNDSH